LLLIATEPRLLPDHIVAVGLLTQRDVNLLGPTFERLWPVEEAPDFEELLQAIDEAERDLSAPAPSAKTSA